MSHYAGPARVLLGTFSDLDAARAERDALIAQGVNAWLEIVRGVSLILWRTVK